MNVLFALGTTQFLNVLKDLPIFNTTEIIPKACMPVWLFAMYHWLMLYPDQEKAQLLIEGFSSGFKLPIFSGLGCQLSKNLKSVLIHTDIVRDKLIKEISANRVAGPFISPPFMNFRVSPLGLVPKKEPNSYRLIHHLSFPVGNSLNDETDPLSASVNYATFDDAIQIIKTFG